MEHAKPWYLSRTIWASLVTIAAAAGGMMGMPVDAGQQAVMTEMALQVVTAVAGVAAFFGRLAATTRIH